MIMIAVLHEVLLTVIPPMLLPLIRPIKIDSQDIPILAEHLSVIHFSQKFYGILLLCFKHSECSKSSNRCHHFKHAKGGYKTKTTIWFLLLGNNSLYFAIIPLTPSATRTIMMGSPNIPYVLGKKGKLLFTCHYSPVTIHWYYSPLLFTPKFCLFKGGCPLYSKQVFFILCSGLLP